MGEDYGLSSKFDDGANTAGRGGNWRNKFLNRRRKSNDDADCNEPHESGSRIRSVSGPNIANRDPGAHAFNNQAVLDQDRALIEQLTQRQPRGGRSAVKKPPPPPKVTPYRTSSRTATPQLDSPGGVDTSHPASQPNTPQGQRSPIVAATPVSPQRVLESATLQRVESLPVIPDVSDEPIPSETGILAAALASCQDPPSLAEARADEAIRLPGSNAEVLIVPDYPMSNDALPMDIAPLARQEAAVVSSAPALKPVVPRIGELFTASDIDAIMDSFGQTIQSNDGSTNGHLTTTFGQDLAGQFAVPTSDRGQCMQNFQDVAKDFFKSHRMDVPQMPEPAEKMKEATEAPALSGKLPEEFKVPERKALREQINAIDSWIEDDLIARERLSERSSGPTADLLGAPLPASKSASTTVPGLAPASKSDDVQSVIFQKLEEAKRSKGLGEKMSPVTLKNLAQDAIPLFPGMSLEALVRALKLFTSARYEDHDLYLRILGEIPVQIRGITPEMLTSCLRVLWRLRLHEETYLELFSMETMNMIRAKRRAAPRAPRRPPALRTMDNASVTAGSSGPMPSPPMTPPSEVLAPFDAEQLIHIGNALSRLGAKHPTRFMEIYQEKLAFAIPRLSQEECELVCPTLAISQLMPDQLRRAFLERCAQVDAGQPMSEDDSLLGSAAPDIAKYQQVADRVRRRAKNFRNIYVLEASVRKETFSFFSSLPPEIRTYLDRLHANAAMLAHEGPSVFASQVATVLDQLGVVCDTTRMAGPLGLHVVAKSTNPRSEFQEIVYECSDTAAFYRLRPDKGSVPELTAWSKIRHRLLQRLGVQLTHISIWEWQHMSEAQRVNYMVKVQSLQ